MRKLVWAGIAVVVLGAAAVYVAADHAAHHPNSWLGRCTAVAGYLGSKCNPLATFAATSHCPASEVCEAAAVPNPDAVPETPDAILQGAVGDDGEAIEPIMVEPQSGFILSLDPVDTPQTVPASEETPEPRFGAGEESEVPSEVAAPAHEDEEGTPPAMSYVEDDAPVCKASGPCTEGCCDKTTCPKGYCETANRIKEAHTGSLMIGIGFSSDSGLVGSIVCKPCAAEGCCVQSCCAWFMSWFGIEGCGKCCDSKPAAAQPVSANPEGPASDTPAEDKPTNDSSKNDDVPNCQEDPSYSHQYPSCPYTGAPYDTCPYYPSFHLPAMTGPEGSPLNEVVPPKKKAKKPAPSSFLRLMPPSYGSLLDPRSPGAHANGLVSALRSVKKTDGEDEGEVHPDVDTMEARPTDVDRISGLAEPF